MSESCVVHIICFIKFLPMGPCCMTCQCHLCFLWINEQSIFKEFWYKSSFQFIFPNLLGLVWRKGSNQRESQITSYSFEDSSIFNKSFIRFSFPFSLFTFLFVCQGCLCQSVCVHVLSDIWWLITLYWVAVRSYQALRPSPA